MLLKIEEDKLDRVIHDITRIISFLKTATDKTSGRPVEYIVSICEKELQEIRNDLLEAIDTGDD